MSNPRYGHSDESSAGIIGTRREFTRLDQPAPAERGRERSASDAGCAANVFSAAAPDETPRQIQRVKRLAKNSQPRVNVIVSSVIAHSSGRSPCASGTSSPGRIILGMARTNDLSAPQGFPHLTRPIAGSGFRPENRVLNVSSSCQRRFEPVCLWALRSVRRFRQGRGQEEASYCGSWV